MNFLFVLGSFYPAQVGGPNNTIFSIAKSLVHSGHHVTVIALTEGLTPHLVSSFQLQINRSNRLEGVECFYFDSIISIARWLYSNLGKHDMLCLTSVFFPLTWLAAIVARYRRVPFNLAPRGELMPNALKYKFFKKMLIWRLVLKRLYTASHFVIATSLTEKACVQNFFPTNDVRVLPNFIDLRSSQNLSELQPKDKNGILYLGRLHPIKAIDRLIAAYSLLPKRITEQHPLILAGEGQESYVSHLRSLAARSAYKNFIHFIGHTEGDAKVHAYRKAKLFVLPSHSENFGNVVIESLAYSTPVVASKQTPWSELSENNCGAWIDNEPEAMALAILQILDMDSNSYSEMVSAAARLGREYSIQQNAGLIEKTLSV